MKRTSLILTLAVLLMAILMTSSAFAADTNAFRFPNNKSIGDLTLAERSNYIYMLEHSWKNPTEAESNAVAVAKSVLGDVANTAKQAVATNMNQVMVEILSGVKNASGEIYHFSKGEAGQAYDFLKHQAPEVVKEFLVWQIAKASVWIAVFGSLAGVLFIFARQLKLRAPNAGHYEDDYNGVKWALRVGATVILLITLGVNGMGMAKCIVAPRVFIIEYVMDVTQGKDTSGYR